MAEVACLVAARPNFVKMAPVLKAIAAENSHTPILIHAGQHYDRELDEFITSDLGMPSPRHHLGVGSGSHATQTAETMLRLEPILESGGFVGLLVAGDVNATMTAALVAAKLHLPLAHLEAGLRSGDRAMPEEINRIVTDAVADICLTPSTDASANLQSEGVPPDRIEFVGNTMIDSLDAHIDEARDRSIAISLGLESGQYGLVTLHRPSNVDTPDSLAATIQTLSEAAERVAMVFPLHPRTKARIEEAGLTVPPTIRLIDPLGYIDFLSLTADARVVLTDSGGIQEETTVLGIPCLTLRDTTERPVTVSEGTNRIVGTDRAEILRILDQVLEAPPPEPCRPKGWDGHASERVAEVLATRWQ